MKIRINKKFHQNLLLTYSTTLEFLSSIIHGGGDLGRGDFDCTRAGAGHWLMVMTHERYLEHDLLTSY